MSAPGARRPTLGRDLAATAALAAYSFVVAAGFARVFSGWGFLTDLGLLVVGGHGSSFLLRRARVSGWIAVPAVGLVLLWLLVAIHYAATMSWLLPTGETWDRIDLEVGLVRDQFQTAVAPVISAAGWATLAGFALIIAIVMADSFAFRAEARGEALVPGGVLFVFIAALGSERLRIGAAAALIAAGVIAVVALRALHDRSRRVELTSARGPVPLVAPAALATAAAVAVLAGFVGPRIPGADAEPLYDTRGRGGGVTEVVSPLVDIRSRLTNRSEVELFRVFADARSYWRLTTLPEFDGRRFQLPQRALTRIEGQFRSDPPSSWPRNRQQIQVLSLGGQLIPAAADPFQADGFSGDERLDLRLNNDTSTLLVVDPEEIDLGDVFTVVSSGPALNPDVLRATSSARPPDPIFVELPDDLPPIVAETAARVTDGAATSYDAALALQDWFQAEFDYSLEVQSGHGANAIESFLNERIGYCEQFSATYAAMARTLGLPSRVAVGFTPGIPNDEGWYSVRGKNAHAWPEVWFDDIGWVAFEPTPGRGAPGAESYTGLPPAQDDSPPGNTQAGAGDAPTSPTTPSTLVPPPATVPGGPTPTFTPGGNVAPGQLPDGGFVDPISSGDAPPVEGSSVPWRGIVVLTVLLGALAGPAVARRVRVRAARAHGQVERVLVAWGRARTAAERAGVVSRPSMTPREWAAATAAQLPVAARPMGSLADVVDLISFAPPGTVDLERTGSFGATLGQDCELWSQQVDRIAVDTLTPAQRLRHYFTDWR